jgi:elongation factor P hydroxylase
MESQQLDVHYTGSVIYVSKTGYGSLETRMLHELGHYIAAGDKRRKMVNYGLKSSGIFSIHQRAEVLACKVQFALMQKLGYTTKYVRRVAEYELYFPRKDITEAIATGRHILKNRLAK